MDYKAIFDSSIRPGEKGESKPSPIAEQVAKDLESAKGSFRKVGLKYAKELRQMLKDGLLDKDLAMDTKNPRYKEARDKTQQLFEKSALLSAILGNEMATKDLPFQSVDQRDKYRAPHSTFFTSLTSIELQEGKATTPLVPRE